MEDDLWSGQDQWGGAAGALERFTSDKSYWDNAEDDGGRDDRAIDGAMARGSGRCSHVAPHFGGHADTRGGGLARLSGTLDGGATEGPHREEFRGRPRWRGRRGGRWGRRGWGPRGPPPVKPGEWGDRPHWPGWYTEPRSAWLSGYYVPLNYADFVPIGVDPADYKFYRMTGWRVAVPRAMSDAAARAMIGVILKYGPQAAGYVRLGDTLVPAGLGPGDRLALAQTATRLGNFGLAYPLL